MKLVAVTRILNEEDIVEAFVRHHAAMIEHHLLIDDGSIDRTIAILHSLKTEGIPLTVLQTTAPFFNQSNISTGLFNHAAQALGADWVLFLDTDEFLDTRRLPSTLHAHLAAIEPETDLLFLPMATYVDRTMGDTSDLLVPRRMRWRRAAEDHPNAKIVLRARLAGAILVDAGHHNVIPLTKNPTGSTQTRLTLAHYPHRSAWQFVVKNVMGRLKVLAAGQQEIARNRSAHYTAPFTAIRDHAHEYLRDPNILRPTYDGIPLIEDPIRYAGADLCHTQPTDHEMRAIRIMTHFGEHLATFAGHLLDANPTLRERIVRNAANCTLLF